jgi:hypothetical protein
MWNISHTLLLTWMCTFRNNIIILCVCTHLIVSNQRMYMCLAWNQLTLYMCCPWVLIYPHLSRQGGNVENCFFILSCAKSAFTVSHLVHSSVSYALWCLKYCFTVFAHLSALCVHCANIVKWIIVKEVWNIFAPVVFRRSVVYFCVCGNETLTRDALYVYEAHFQQSPTKHVQLFIHFSY